MKKMVLVLTVVAVVSLFFGWPFLPGMTFIATSLLVGKYDNFEANAHSVAVGVRKILMDEGKCSATSDCSDAIFMKPIKDGFIGYVYGETREPTLNKITSVFAQEFSNNADIKYVRIEVYPFSKKDEKYFVTFPLAISRTKWEQGAVLSVEMSRI